MSRLGWRLPWQQARLGRRQQQQQQLLLLLLLVSGFAGMTAAWACSVRAGQLAGMQALQDLLRLGKEETPGGWQESKRHKTVATSEHMTMI